MAVGSWNGSETPLCRFVGNFVAFVESIWWSLTEAQRRGEPDPPMDANGREWKVFFLTAKNAINAKGEPRMHECTHEKWSKRVE